MDREGREIEIEGRDDVNCFCSGCLMPCGL
jgi:hypothetical protein